jgi:hypothetical protein
MTDRFDRLQKNDRVTHIDGWEGIVTEVLQVFESVEISVARDDGGIWRGLPGYLQKEGQSRPPRCA